MKHKKVLVTGSSGFIGSHIADILDENGYEVVLFDTISSLYKRNTQTELIGDILKFEDVYEAMEGCSIVYHFAAHADINTSSINPTKVIKNNIIGTQNVLESARQNKVNRVLFASTIYVYSELGSFYRVSKQACEKIIEEYQKEFELDYTILRFGSIYGPRANDFNAIQDFITQAIKNKKIIRRGDGNEIREYIHVKDAAELSLQSLDDKYKNMALIVTGNQQIKVKELLTMIQEIFDGDIEIEYGNENELHHYEITPYSFKPQVARKITPELYYDLGQGILDLIYVIQQTLGKEKKQSEITLRKRKNDNN